MDVIFGILYYRWEILLLGSFFYSYEIILDFGSFIYDFLREGNIVIYCYRVREYLNSIFLFLDKKYRIRIVKIFVYNFKL